MKLEAVVNCYYVRNLFSPYSTILKHQISFFHLNQFWNATIVNVLYAWLYEKCLTLKALTNLTNNEKKEFASVVLGDSAKNSTHSLNASCAILASLFSLRSLSSAFAKKSLTTKLWLPRPRISASFRTASMPFSSSVTSVLIFSKETKRW